MIQGTIRLIDDVNYMTWNIMMTNEIKTLKTYRYNLNSMSTVKREGKSRELVIV